MTPQGYPGTVAAPPATLAEHQAGERRARRVAGLLRSSALAGGMAAAAMLASARSAPAGEPAAGPAGRPNVIFIMSDDQRREDLGCYGNRRSLTPNIDRLSAGGARFTRACVTTAVCGPSRICFLTGKYLGRFVECPDNQRSVFPASQPTLATRLKAAGYRTGFIGKAHFQVKGLKVPTKNVEARMKALGFDFVGDGHNADFQKGTHERHTKASFDEAIRFVTENRDRPFALLVFTTLVHGPHEAPDGYVKRARAVNPRAHAMDAMNAWLDDEIGRLVKKVDDLGIRKRTAIFYTTDNAPATGKGANKRTVYDGWVPLIANWPGVIAPGLVREELVQNIDFLPTVMEICARAPPAAGEVDGCSFLPLLTGRRVEWRKEAVLECGAARAVRTDRWKYIAVREVPRMGTALKTYLNEYGGQKDLLFDLAADPAEKKNLFADPAHAATVREMQARLRAHCATCTYAFGEFGGGGKK